MSTQAAEAERRVLEAARKARAEVEAQLAEKDPEAMGLDASGRRLLSQNRAMAKELELHIEVLALILVAFQQATMHVLAIQAVQVSLGLEYET